MVDIVVQFVDDYGVQLGLVVVLVGDDLVSCVYVNCKVRIFECIGLYLEKHVFLVTVIQDEVISLVCTLNVSDKVHGILLQLLLLLHINEWEIVEIISLAKDVDCFYFENVGCLLIGDEDCFYLCTLYGILVLLNYYQIDLRGKYVVVVGCLNFVGKFIVVLLVCKVVGVNVIVMLCYFGINDLVVCCQTVDILVVVMGWL